MDKDKERGLYDKYIVTRPDGSAVTGAFVLRPEYDPAAYTAILVYAQRCAKEYPKLAEDILAWTIRITESGGPSGAR